MSGAPDAGRPTEREAGQGPVSIERLAVVGCGLIGASFAVASRAVPGVREVVVTDADELVRERARAIGVADRVVASVGEAVADADLVLLAVPVAVLPVVAAEAAAAMRPGALLTDTGSTKSQLVRKVEGLRDIRESGVRFIGGHPMAGSERSGVEAADGTIFQGATWLLTPTPRADMGAFNALAGHLRAIGARVLAVDPVLHDRLVAVASHLPQLLASTLMLQAVGVAEHTGDGILSVAGGGFRDVTRVAASDPDLWIGILEQNRGAVLDAVDTFLTELTSLRHQVAAEDWDGVRTVLARARAGRQQLPSKEVSGVLVDLVVAVEDRPGVLAQVTTTLGEAGVNIEDLSMRHASAGGRGALVVAVDGHDTAHRARRLLAERGLNSHVEPRASA